MLKDIVESQWITDVTYSREFTRKDTSGFSFPCDEHGNVFPFEYEEAQRNYERCLANESEFDLEFNEFRRWKNTYREPAHGTCVCGEEVYLINEYMGACECPKCGRWYNLFGQELLPPDQWESDYYDDY